MNNFIEIEGLEQNTLEWEEWRRTGIGASDAHVIVNPKGLFGKTAFTLWLHKVNGIKAEFTEVAQEHMKRGHELEPTARELFIKRTGIYVEPLCVQSVTHPFMLVSIDGISLDRRVLCEIKAPAKAMFEKMLESNDTPEYYKDQVQHQLGATGADECYFFAFNPDIEPYVFMKLHQPDYARIQEIIRLEQLFKKHVDFRVPPNTVLGLDKAEIGIAGLTMIAGYATVGKDEYGKIHQGLFKSTRYGFADPLKNMYCELRKISRLKLEAEKSFHRQGLIDLGHGMRQVDPNIWVNGVFNPRTGIYEAMSKEGAVITDTRYVNEASAGRRAAAKLGVPFRLIWIDRHGVGPVHQTEAETTSLLRSMADVIIVNDANILTEDGLAASQMAMMHAMSVVPDGSQKTISAFSFIPSPGTTTGRIQSRKPNVTKRSTPSRKTRTRTRR